MAKTRVLITVKTYPEISTKYNELVCTAGFREDGSMVRIYPIQFRELPFDQQYKKYDWIEVSLERKNHDFRPESYRPSGEIEVVGSLSTGKKKDWTARKKIVLRKVFTNLETLIAEAKDKTKPRSLAVFKPTTIKDFTAEPCAREWSKAKKDSLRQLNLFQKKGTELEVVRKLPYKFSYRFTDSRGKESTLMVEDWEVGALFWNMLADCHGDEKAALKKVKQKFLDELGKTKDLHFFLGTTLEHHAKNAPNPFIIIGVFYPPNEHQLGLPGM